MGAETTIGWTRYTFNPWIGCTKVSPACDRCYAEEWAKTWAKDVTWGKPGQHAKLRRTKTWRDPIGWNKKAAQAMAAHQAEIIKSGPPPERPRVFCASLADVFDNDAPNEWRRDLWELIDATPALDWLLLTKRPQNIAGMLWHTVDGDRPRKNVWLGTTVENQEEADRRIPHLLAVPAAVRFLSCEPLLGPVDLARYLPAKMACSGCGYRTNDERAVTCCSGHCLDASGKSCNAWPCPKCSRVHYWCGSMASVSWVIIGGESGTGFRRMSMEWVASLRVQCLDARVPVFFKQDSSIKPGSKGRASPELWACKQFPKVAA